MPPTESLTQYEEGLSKRAMEILRLLGEDLSDNEIAERLVLSINTVKWYNRQIYSILGVGRRRHAVARARELHLIDGRGGSESDITGSKGGYSQKHNLPVETTHFIGRRHETEALKGLLETAHLLTLVGPPGTGKTRLALRIAWEVAEMYRDGVYFVSLAPIGDPALVTHAIASIIGVNEVPDQPLLETLKRVLRESQMLLILDNFEHLLAAAAQVSELLAAAPHLKVLATSREPLHLHGEQEYAVPPLDLPDPERIDLQRLAECESAALFLQQARAVQPDFELTEENALDIARICLSLDGLPLAIELAAARVKLFAPQTLLTRLKNRLNTLTSGVRNALQRHQTLRDALDWSFDLLTEDEKLLFSRLSVFAGGRSLDAIEDVCGVNLKIDVLDGLDSLLNKSLLKVVEQGPLHSTRFVLLETMHEYAREKLDQTDESSILYTKHAEWFVNLAERAEPELRGRNQKFWLDSLAVEEDNFRAILDRCRNHLIDPVLGLRLAGSLRHFWRITSLREGDAWLNQMLSLTQGADPGLRAKALCGAGTIAYHRGDYDRAEILCKQALEISRQIGDRHISAQAVHFIAHVTQHHGDYSQGEALLTESLSLSREIGDLSGAAQALNCLGESCRLGREYEKARALIEEAHGIYREIQDLRGLCSSLTNLGMLLQRLEEYDQAMMYLHEAFDLGIQLNSENTLGYSIIGLAGLSAARGHSLKAALLIGIAETMLNRAGTSLPPTDQVDYELYAAATRDQLDPAAFKELKDKGQAMSFEAAIDYVKREVVNVD